MGIVIKVENLGKKYIISHQQEKYTALRDVMVNSAKTAAKAIIGKKTLLPKKEEFWALRNIDFEVNAGDRIGIIGRNGAGKSTLLKLLSRITEPTTGKIKIKGRVASLLEVGTGFHQELTGRENVFLNGAVLGMSKKEIQKKFDEIVEFAGVEKFIDTPVKRYSSGMYVRLAFAIAANIDPDILIVDEVLAVGDAQFQEKSLGKMREVSKSQGRTVIFVSHNMGAIENLCSTTILLDRGMTILQDKTDKVINYYLKNILSKIYESIPLDQRVDRSGNGLVRFKYFYIRNENGEIISSAKSGTNITLVFGYECKNVKEAKNIDLGFSIHSYDNYMLGVLYSSYMKKLFNLKSKKGEICFKINNLFLSEGRYNIGARILVNGVESDWLKDGIGFLEVISGDFYKTGRLPEYKAPLLISGDWILNEVSH
jgi:ABC-type polysaccharide/polyol phosphate transport system, ATPase component